MLYLLPRLAALAVPIVPTMLKRFY